MDGWVGIVGAGTMGAGIAQVALEAGEAVALFDPDLVAVDRARERIETGLVRRLTRTATDAVAIRELVGLRLERLTRVASLAELAEPAELVIEAAVEDLAIKRRIFAVLDAGAPEAAVLATNTSALSVGSMATATRHPERVLGLHFFNPAPLMDLVEVVAGRRTGDAVVDAAERRMTAWGKTPIRCADAPGFIVNRVNRPFTVQALRILEAGTAGIEAIDAAMRADGFPMGPFELMDLIGIDVNLAVTRALDEAFRLRGGPDADRFRPSTIQEWLVDAGRLGRKTGEGFYRYDGDRRVGPADAFSAGPTGTPSPGEAIAERIRAAILQEAIRTVDEGVAPAGDVDRALRLGAGHPRGPFEDRAAQEVRRAAERGAPGAADA